MKKIRIEKPSEERLKKSGVFSWPIWERQISRFDWKYDTDETCYFLEGEVEVITEEGTSYRIKKGDWVEFPKGLKCVWDIKKPVRKHYKLG
ncbi:MAG: cupin domain-containing protein [Candidatus Omnitrophica bacterium]|nr:cupin domain-containing protein [Candidatus Omnitrophota bacterium]